MTIKRFIVYLATDIPADGRPLACYLTSGKGLRILSIISAAGGGILLAHLGNMMALDSKCAKLHLTAVTTTLVHLVRRG